MSKRVTPSKRTRTRSGACSHIHLFPESDPGDVLYESAVIVKGFDAAGNTFVRFWSSPGYNDHELAFHLGVFKDKVKAPLEDWADYVVGSSRVGQPPSAVDGVEDDED